MLEWIRRGLFAEKPITPVYTPMSRESMAEYISEKAERKAEQQKKAIAECRQSIIDFRGEDIAFEDMITTLLHDGCVVVGRRVPYYAIPRYETVVDLKHSDGWAYTFAFDDERMAIRQIMEEETLRKNKLTQ